MHYVKSGVHYGVFSGPYFPSFGLNTERYKVSPARMRENTDQKKLRISQACPQSKYLFTIINKLHKQTCGFLRRSQIKKLLFEQL